MSTPKFFSSGMVGSPQLTPSQGSMVSALDACLVTGFGLQAVSGIVVASGIATVTYGASHPFLPDNIALFEGAVSSGVNGEQRILTVGPLTVTFATAAADGTATGTITSKVAPLGFEIAFSGTNKRVYRSPNVLSNRPYLRVDDSLDPANTAAYAKKAKVTACSAMTGIDTFTGQQAPYDPSFPLRNHTATGTGASVVDGWHKWYYARTDTVNQTDTVAHTASARSWVLIGDDRGFYFFTEHTPVSGGKAGYCFTDFASFRGGDGFNTLLAATDFGLTASTAPSSVSPGGYAGPDFGGTLSATISYIGKVILRDHTQIGGPIRAGFATLNTNNSSSISGYQTGIQWPNGPDYSLVLHPVYLRQENGHLRGKMPGMMWVHNDLGNALSDQTVVENVAGYPGRKFILIGSGHSTAITYGNVARLAFDITGPWW